MRANLNRTRVETRRIGQHIDARRIERIGGAIGKDQVVCPRCSAGRVRARLGNGWQNGGRIGRDLAVDCPLISDEEECLVAVEEVRNLQRSAHGAAKLIAFEQVRGVGSCLDIVGEVVRRVQVGIADIFKQIAVIAVGAALGDDVHHAARVLAVLSVVVVGFDAELLDCIGHGEGHVDVGVLVDVVAAVEHVVGLPRQCAVGGDRNRRGEGLGIPLVGLCGRR